MGMLDARTLGESEQDVAGSLICIVPGAVGGPTGAEWLAED